MKPNRCKQLMAAGKVPVGHMIMEFGTRNIARILARAEADFVLIDTEHSGFTSADIADLIAWFRGTEIAPFVRVPQTQYHFIARALDAGALGIMVPNVKTGSQAQAVVDAAKYAPLGKRGVILGNANTDFQTVVPREFMDYANENTTIICQIESEEGLGNLDEIAATPGIDILWVGHFDLTQSMGIPGQFHHHRFLEALKQVAAAARLHGLGMGGQPGSPEQAREWLDLGYNIISYGADHAVYRQAITQALADVRRLVEG